MLKKIFLVFKKQVNRGFSILKNLAKKLAVSAFALCLAALETIPYLLIPMFCILLAFGFFPLEDKISSLNISNETKINLILNSLIEFEILQSLIIFICVFVTFVFLVLAIENICGYKLAKDKNQRDKYKELCISWLETTLISIALLFILFEESSLKPIGAAYLLGKIDIPKLASELAFKTFKNPFKEIIENYKKGDSSKKRLIIIKYVAPYLLVIFMVISTTSYDFVGNSIGYGIIIYYWLKNYKKTKPELIKTIQEKNQKR